jgi:hypothetical protein
MSTPRRPAGRYGEDDSDSSQVQAPPSPLAKANSIVILPKPPMPKSSLDTLVNMGDWEGVLMKTTTKRR